MLFGSFWLFALCFLLGFFVFVTSLFPFRGAKEEGKGDGTKTTKPSKKQTTKAVS